jgi:hypothetical protein
MNGAIQSWLVPENVTAIEITARGAQGGAGGGNGAVLSAYFSVQPGSELFVYVGEEGASAHDGSGGGGSGVVDAEGNVLIVAGGGGGGSGYEGGHASLNANGNSGQGNGSTSPGYGGVNGGSGGDTYFPNYDHIARGGSGIIEGLVNPMGENAAGNWNAGLGSFGMGGGGGSVGNGVCNCGGGGGGYSGGGAGAINRRGGGGGSFSAAPVIWSEIGIDGNTGSGAVRIRAIAFAQ